MTEEPYRWLEAVANRREYAEGQLKGGSPVFAISLDEGILLLGVGTGQSKVFEIFDRHALAGLGHPADMERVRQGLIDAAHLEAFTRAPEDVSLRRLVSYGLSPQLKTAFEQIFSPPFLVRLVLAEVADTASRDVLVSTDYDGSFVLKHGGCAVAADDPATARAAEDWLATRIASDATAASAAQHVMEAWRHLVAGKSLPNGDGEGGTPPASAPVPQGRRNADRGIEAALLMRKSPGPARYRSLDAAQLGLLDSPLS